MDKKTVEKIKKELLARKKQIEEDLKNITQQETSEKGEHRAKFPDLGSKTEENVMEIGEYSTNLATEKVLESSLRDIDNTLKRIEEGTYGVCKYCEKEIGEKRLLARPVASTCVECKSKLQSKV
jgi:DnaK suppressor protein